jgi:predicted GNAT family N-acyltransferase
MKNRLQRLLKLPNVTRGNDLHELVDRIEILSSIHDREAFYCGVESLDIYIKRQASQDARRRISVTHVAVAKDNNTKIVGYYTLSATTITPALIPEKGFPKAIPLPAILLGRLAIDISAQGSGLGSYLLMDALSRAQRVAESEMGAVAVVVDALPNAVSFYTKYGFQRLLDDELHLYLPMNTIKKLALNS